jgi:hypothetical protein
MVHIYKMVEPRYPNFRVYRDENLNSLISKKINGVTDPDLCSTGIKQVYFDDFSNFTLADPSGYFYADTSFFGPPYDPPYNNFITNDAAGGVSYDSVGGFIDINSIPFTKTFSPDIPVPLPVDGTLNRLQYFVFSNASFELPDDGSEFVTEIEVAVQCALGDLDPLSPSSPSFLSGLTNTSADARISCFLFSVQDYLLSAAPSYCAYDFLVCNESIYAINERFADGKPAFGGPGPNYESFIEATEIGKRNKDDPLNDFVKLAISINRKEQVVKFYINGVEKYKVSRFGYPADRTFRTTDTDGPPLSTDIQSVSFAFGNINALDNSNVVYDTSLPMAMVDAGNSDAVMPLVQYNSIEGNIDPKRVNRIDGSDVHPFTAPYSGAQQFAAHVNGTNGGDPFPFRNRLFGNGARSRIKKIRSYFIDTVCNKDHPLSN